MHGLVPSTPYPQLMLSPRNSIFPCRAGGVAVGMTQFPDPSDDGPVRTNPWNVAAPAVKASVLLKTVT